MALKYYEDWQSSKKTVLQRNAYMFDNELMSDVSFTSGERVAYFMLINTCSRRAVLYSLLCFTANLAQQEFFIRLEDTDYESFKEFLGFLYTNNCKIRAENAIGVMY